MQEHFIPAYNAHVKAWRLCVQCGTRFGIVDGRTEQSESCGEDCADALRQSRRRERKRNRSVEEIQTDAERAEERARTHVETCKAVPRCSQTGLCPIGKQLGQQLENAKIDLERAQDANGGDLTRRGDRTAGNYDGSYLLDNEAMPADSDTPDSGDEGNDPDRLP